jgi:hypothetical protein
LYIEIYKDKHVNDEQLKKYKFVGGYGSDDIEFVFKNYFKNDE